MMALLDKRQNFQADHRQHARHQVQNQTANDSRDQHGHERFRRVGTFSNYMHLQRAAARVVWRRNYGSFRSRFHRAPPGCPAFCSACLATSEYLASWKVSAVLFAAASPTLNTPENLAADGMSQEESLHVWNPMIPSMAYCPGLAFAGTSKSTVHVTG